ncbi:uncharacterized protein YbjT (DUF2867 family) [Bradyrhizobium sp. AZCC 1678]
MKAILFGATGMVGQGVLRECLIDAGVERVLAVGRSPTRVQHAKLHEVLHDNFTDFSAIESQLSGYDACFFCLGVSSIGMDPERYRHPAAARRKVEDWLGERDLCRDRAAVVVSRPHRAAIHDHQRAARPRHDQGRARWLSEADT